MLHSPCSFDEGIIHVKESIYTNPQDSNPTGFDFGTQDMEQEALSKSQLYTSSSNFWKKHVKTSCVLKKWILMQTSNIDIL